MPRTPEEIRAHEEAADVLQQRRLRRDMFMALYRTGGGIDPGGLGVASRFGAPMLRQAKALGQTIMSGIRKAPLRFDPEDPLGSTRYLLKQRDWGPPGRILSEAERTPAARVAAAANPKAAAEFARYEGSMYRINNLQTALEHLSDARTFLPPERAAYYGERVRKLNDLMQSSRGFSEGLTREALAEAPKKPLPDSLVKGVRNLLKEYEVDLREMGRR